MVQNVHRFEFQWSGGWEQVQVPLKGRARGVSGVWATIGDDRIYVVSHMRSVKFHSDYVMHTSLPGCPANGG